MDHICLPSIQRKSFASFPPLFPEKNPCPLSFFPSPSPWFFILCLLCLSLITALCLSGVEKSSLFWECGRRGHRSIPLSLVYSERALVSISKIRKTNHESFFLWRISDGSTCFSLWTAFSQKTWLNHLWPTDYIQ